MAENKENEMVDVLDTAQREASPSAPIESNTDAGASAGAAPGVEEAKGAAPAEGTDPSAEDAEVRKAMFSNLVPTTGEGMKHNLDLLLDVTVPLTVELGQTSMKIEEVLKLSPGAVIELDTHADEPIELKVNGKLIARGEIVVVEDFFGIRICEIVTVADGPV